MFQCAYKAVKEGDLAALKAVLSSATGDVNEIVADPIHGQTTLLMTAVYETDQKSSHAVTRMLLEHGAAPNLTCGSQSDTPLHNVRDARMVELLLAFGANIDARTGDGDTPLAWIIVDRRVDVLPALLQGGAALDAVYGARHGLSPPRDALEYAEMQWSHVRVTLKYALENHAWEKAKRELTRMIDLLAAFRSAGSWKRYERERVVPLLSLRYLCLAGRATAPAHFLRLFGSAPMSKCAARTRSKRLAHSAAQRPLPDDVFEHVLTFWDGI